MKVDRNKIITIQYQSLSVDSFGQPVDTWTDFLSNIWAAVEPISGREFFASKETNSEITTRVRIEYLENINTKMRIIYGTKIYDIQSIIDYKEKHNELQLMCKEVI